MLARIDGPKSLVCFDELHDAIAPGTVVRVTGFSLESGKFQVNVARFSDNAGAELHFDMGNESVQTWTASEILRHLGFAFAPLEPATEIGILDGEAPEVATGPFFGREPERGAVGRPA